MDKFVVCIPARYASSRLPGKPLRLIAGKELILWALESAAKLNPDELVVATDDQRIMDCVIKSGHHAVMTSSAHTTGTDRLAECANIMGWSDDVVVLNHQGDEPNVPVDNMLCVIQALQQDPKASIATLYQPINDLSTLFDPNVVKVVHDHKNVALYFSRAPIPWQQGQVKPCDSWQVEQGLYKKHVGLYAYTVSFLKDFANADSDIVESVESLEQLRAIRLGYRILVLPATQPMPQGIDTEQDLWRFEQALEKQ